MFNDRTVIRAGALLKGAIRRQLDIAKFNGHSVSYTEDRGLLTSTFYITGPSYFIDALNDLVDQTNQL